MSRRKLAEAVTLQVSGQRVGGPPPPKGPRRECDSLFRQSLTGNCHFLGQVCNYTFELMSDRLYPQLNGLSRGQRTSHRQTVHVTHLHRHTATKQVSERLEALPQGLKRQGDSSCKGLGA